MDTFVNKKYFKPTAFLCILFLMLALVFPALVFPNTADAAPAEVTAKVKAVKGEVFVKKGSGNKEFKAFENMTVSQGDWIRTGEKSSCKIVYNDGTETMLSANSKVTIQRLTASKNGSQTSVKVYAGGAWSKVKTMVNADDSYDVETPTTVLGVRGTLYLVTVDADGNVSVDVVDGAIAAGGNSDPGAGSTSFLIGTGSSLQVGTDGQSGGQQPLAVDHLVQNVDPAVLVQVVNDIIERVQEMQAQTQQNLSAVNNQQSALNALQSAARAGELASLARQVVETVQSADPQLAESFRQELQSNNQNLEDLLQDIDRQVQETQNLNQQAQQKAQEQGLDEDTIQQAVSSITDAVLGNKGVNPSTNETIGTLTGEAGGQEPGGPSNEGGDSNPSGPGDNPLQITSAKMNFATNIFTAVFNKPIVQADIVEYQGGGMVISFQGDSQYWFCLEDQNNFIRNIYDLDYTPGSKQINCTFEHSADDLAATFSAKLYAMANGYPTANIIREIPVEKIQENATGGWQAIEGLPAVPSEGIIDYCVSGDIVYAAFADPANEGKLTVMKYDCISGFGSPKEWSVLGENEESEPFQGSPAQISLAVYQYEEIPYVAYVDAADNSVYVYRFIDGSWQLLGESGESVFNSAAVSDIKLAVARQIVDTDGMNLAYPVPYIAGREEGLEEEGPGPERIVVKKYMPEDPEDPVLFSWEPVGAEVATGDIGPQIDLAVSYYVNWGDGTEMPKPQIYVAYTDYDDIPRVAYLTDYIPESESDPVPQWNVVGGQDMLPVREDGKIKLRVRNYEDYEEDSDPSTGLYLAYPAGEDGIAAKIYRSERYYEGGLSDLQPVGEYPMLSSDFDFEVYGNCFMNSEGLEELIYLAAADAQGNLCVRQGIVTEHYYYYYYDEIDCAWLDIGKTNGSLDQSGFAQIEMLLAESDVLTPYVSYLTEEGQPVVIKYDYGVKFYGWSQSPDWQQETLSGNASTYPAMAADSQGTPYIAYVEAGSIVVKKQNCGTEGGPPSWEEIGKFTPESESGLTYTGPVNLAFSGDVLYISYLVDYPEESPEIIVQKYGGSSWEPLGFSEVQGSLIDYKMEVEAKAGQDIVYLANLSTNDDKPMIEVKSLNCGNLPSGWSVIATIQPDETASEISFSDLSFTVKDGRPYLAYIEIAKNGVEIVYSRLRLAGYALAEGDSYEWQDDLLEAEFTEFASAAGAPGESGYTAQHTALKFDPAGGELYIAYVENEEESLFYPRILKYDPSKPNLGAIRYTGYTYYNGGFSDDIFFKEPDTSEEPFRAISMDIAGDTLYLAVAVYDSYYRTVRVKVYEMGTAEADSVYLSMLGSPEGIDTLRWPEGSNPYSDTQYPLTLKVVNGQPLLSYAVSDQAAETTVPTFFGYCLEGGDEVEALPKYSWMTDTYKCYFFDDDEWESKIFLTFSVHTSVNLFGQEVPLSQLNYEIQPVDAYSEGRSEWRVVACHYQDLNETILTISCNLLKIEGGYYNPQPGSYLVVVKDNQGNTLGGFVFQIEIPS